MNTTPRRAAIYGRISDVKKAADAEKVPAQIALCEKAAQAAGYVIVGTFREEDATSASGSAQRPKFEALLALIESGAVDVVMATEDERLERNAEDGHRLRKALKASGVDVHTVRGGVTSYSTASGVLTGTIKSAVAAYESENKAERQKAAYERLRSEGMPHPGPRVFGWKAGRMELEPVEAQMIRDAYDSLLRPAGERPSLYSILRTWNESGVLTTREKAWTYAGLQQVLKRARNAAVMEHGKDNPLRDETGSYVIGRWDPIVSVEDWQAMVAALTDSKNVLIERREPHHLLSGIAKCGVCGQTMRPTHGNGQRYYRCASRQNGVSDGQKHSAYVADALDDIAINAVVSALTYAPSDALPTDPETARLGNLYADLSDVRSRIDRLVEMVMSGALSVSDVATRRAALEAEAVHLQDEIDTLTVTSAKAALVGGIVMSVTAGKASLTGTAKAKEELTGKVNALPLGQRRDLIRALVDVMVFPGRKPDRVDVLHKVATTLNAPM